MSLEVTGLDWSNERMLPAFQAPSHLEIYDMRGASRDIQLTATTLVGLVNRPQPRVYLIVGDDDAFWLAQVFHAIPQEIHPSKGDKVLKSLLTVYRDAIQGLIIYDPNLIETINVATTLAGQRDGIVVAPAQVADLQQDFGLSILVDLRTYHWKNRWQAYHWAWQNLRQDASHQMVAGLDPKNVTGLRSFLVATRTLIYRLDSRAHLSNLRQGGHTERNLMRQIVNSYPPGATHLGWFIDESSGVRLTSQAALAVLATDHLTNLEVWTAIQPQTKTSPPLVVELPAISERVYVSFTISDGDNLQYCQHHMQRLWRDPARGTLPIGWTLSPVLMQAAPAMAEYYLSTATANDELIAGPSGAGYIFPSHWPSKHLSPFLQRTGQMMQDMGMVSLQVLDTVSRQNSALPFMPQFASGMTFVDSTSQQRYVQGLTAFGLQGILSGAGLRACRWQKTQGLPLYHNLGLAGSVGQTVRWIKNAALAQKQRPLFLNVYMLAWSITPSDLRQIVERLGDGYAIVLPKTLLAMLAKIN